MENKEEKVKTRYSDSELEEFKQLVLKKLKVERTELEALKTSLQITNASSAGRSDESTLHTEKESLNAQINRLQTFIDQLEAALVRIKNKTYGICRETGKLILKERLKAVPHTTLCMEAKLNRKPKSQHAA